MIEPYIGGLIVAQNAFILGYLFKISQRITSVETQCKVICGIKPQPKKEDE